MMTVRMLPGRCGEGSGGIPPPGHIRVAAWAEPTEASLAILLHNALNVLYY